MITCRDLEDRAVDLTPRQSEALTLVERYYAVAGECPSYGWLGRRIGISRKNAFALMQRMRDRPRSARGNTSEPMQHV